MNLFFNILNSKQAELLEKIVFLKKEGFYLAGGTGLALQLGHRTSLDFDFYCPKSFNEEKLLTDLKKYCSEVKVIRMSTGTLTLIANEINLSFFHYPYPLIRDFVDSKNITIASIEDIIAMKIIAIVQRGKLRDFIDIYFLLKKFSLNQIITFTKEKYLSYEEILILKALIYFADADKETTAQRGIKIFDPNFSWPKAKKLIFSEVRKYRL